MKKLSQSSNEIVHVGIVGQSNVIAMKTCAQSGTSKLFMSRDKYVNHVQSTGECHRIVDLDQVTELQNEQFVITESMFGTHKIGIKGFEYSINEFVDKYQK